MELLGNTEGNKDRDGEHPTVQGGLGACQKAGRGYRTPPGSTALSPRGAPGSSPAPNPGVGPQATPEPPVPTQFSCPALAAFPLALLCLSLFHPPCFSLLSCLPLCVSPNNTLACPHGIQHVIPLSAVLGGWKKRAVPCGCQTGWSHPWEDPWGGDGGKRSRGERPGEPAAPRDTATAGGGAGPAQGLPFFAPKG